MSLSIAPAPLAIAFARLADIFLGGTIPVLGEVDYFRRIRESARRAAFEPSALGKGLGSGPVCCRRWRPR
jgi:hypothetical protein